MSTPEEAKAPVDEGHFRALRVGERAADLLGTWMAALSGLGIVLIMVGTVFDVIRRATTGRGLAGINEWSEIALVMVVFLGLIGAQRSGTQIATPIVTNRMPARVGHFVRAASAAVATLIVLWMFKETAAAGYESYMIGEFKFGIVHVPVWPAKILIPIGLLALALALVVQMLEHAGRFLRNDPKQVVELQEL